MVKEKLNANIALGENIFRVAVENTPTGVCITNKDGIFEYVNKAFCELYEYSHGELIGKIFTIVVPDEWKASMQLLHDEYIDGKNEVRGEWNVITKSGKHLVILAEAVRIKNFDGEFKKITFVTDITERKMREIELQKFYLSIESSSSSIVITDCSGSVCYINPSFCEITGYSQKEIVGNNLRIIKSGVHDNQFYKTMWDTISNGKTWRGEICNKSKSGKLFWESTVITPIVDKSGKIVNYVAIKNDISERIDLEQLKEDVDRILRHDLRTPLNAIIALPQMIKDNGELTLDQKNDLALIEMSGWRMLRMIDSSLDIFKMEEGTYQHNPTAQDVISVANKVVENLQDSLDTFGANIVFLLNSEEVLPGDEFVILTEEMHFYTMFSNLLANAIEASPSGSDVVVNFKSGAPSQLSIANTGVVPQIIREHFFEKYKTSGKQHGTGLGTYSAKMIATSMNYRIEMQTSDELNKTTVTIIFCNQ